jgi:hypothetical protein
MEKKTMNEERKIYSINLAAYLIATTDLLPKIEYDSASRTYYFVFPQTQGVSWSIDKYKNGNPTIRLHSFLKAIKQVRESINVAKGTGVEQ